MSMNLNNSSINDLLYFEQHISEIVEQIKKDIQTEIKEIRNPNYTPINSFCGVVKFSALKNSRCWNPYYFIPQEQSKVVEEALKPVKTLSALKSKLCSLITEKQIKIGKNTYLLNPITISVLERYVE